MVAEEAGVGVTVVSYVLNDNRYVDKDKRRRVLEAVERLGYRPNAIARSLKLKRTKHILFIADRIANEHFGSLMNELDRELYDKGYLISLARERGTDDFIRHTISRQFDGIIVSSLGMREKHINSLAASGVPVVLMMNREYGRLRGGIAKVYPGLYEGARECVRRLRAAGRRHICYVDRFSEAGHFNDMRDLRLRGYRDETAAPEGTGCITGCRTEEEMLEKIAALCASGAPVDAVIARNDLLAAAVMGALRRCGRSVPDDIAVIGFDNTSVSRYVIPALTTVEIDRPAMAGALLDGLWSLMEGRTPPPRTLSTRLIVRESTGKI